PAWRREVCCPLHCADCPIGPYYRECENVTRREIWILDLDGGRRCQDKRQSSVWPKNVCEPSRAYYCSPIIHVRTLLQEFPTIVWRLRRNHFVEVHAHSVLPKSGTPANVKSRVLERNMICRHIGSRNLKPIVHASLDAFSGADSAEVHDLPVAEQSRE